jgi:drug/metabolite transporter (DMT)-like permease
MSLRIVGAYLGVILLWSTTPLAIKWSGEGPGYLFGVAGRMTLGLFGVVLMLSLTRTRLRMNGRALWTYLAGAVHIYGSMLMTYWASQHIPSGWISVVFGLTPLLTAPLAAFFLREQSLTLPRLLSYLMGVAGLALMFHSALTFSREAALAIGAVLLASLFQAISSVWVKRIDARLPAFSLVCGSLLLAVPAYLLTWYFLDGRWPEHIPPRSLLSIAYLGVVATTFGFSLYFFVLKHLPAGRVALISLVTPVLSLYIGLVANHEVIHDSVLVGTALIVGALLLHETRLPARRRGNATVGDSV